MRRASIIIVAALLAALASGCGKRRVVRAPAPPAANAPAASIGAVETGIASWYGVPYHGRRAASGEIYDMEQLTAAHPTLPFQTWVRVTNLDNDREVEVRITDRGPFVDGRIIDLSLAAAREIDMVRSGVAPVRLTVIEAPPRAGIPPPSPAAGSIAANPGPSGDYAVQAGAFADPARAERVRQSLLLYPDARVQPLERDPVLWRVLVGHGLSRTSAARLAEEIELVTGQAFAVPDR